MGDLRQPPSPMLVLAADTLAARATAFIKEICTCDEEWKELTDLRQALEAYAEVRKTQIIQSAQATDCNEPCPKTERAT